MAGRKLNNAAYQDQNWIDETESKNILKLGSFKAGFIDDGSSPKIEAGSSVDIDGVIYIWDSEEAITDPGVTDGTVYVTATGGETGILSFTNTELPEYNYIKKGYYGVSGERYIAQYNYDGVNFLLTTILNEGYRAVYEANTQNLDFMLSLISSTGTKIVAHDAQPEDLLSYSVSIYGDYAIIGTYGEDTGGTDAGAAYIFHRTGANTWDAGTKIVAPDAQTEDYFGVSVSIYGDYAIVGASAEDAAATNAGAAYIFYRTGTNTWDAGTKIVAPDAEAGDQFGSVSIYGDYAIVGASVKGLNVGAAYIFNRTGTNTWDTGTKIVAPDADTSDFFGNSVSIYGDYAIVGAPGENTGGTDAGAAYIFYRTGTNTWDTGTKIAAPDAEANNQFGNSVSIYGDYAIVGAYLEDTGGSNAGAAYIFYRTGTNTWDTGTKIVAPDAQPGDVFGVSVSIDGDYAIVGARREDTGGTDAGAAYIFHRTGANTWDTGTKIVAPDAQPGDLFGDSVSIYGDYFIVRAHYEGAGGSSAGAAYIYRLPWLG